MEVVTKPEPVTGDLLQARINRARQIAESIDNSFWVNQYANLYNARAHRQTIAEIVMTLHGPVGYLFWSASSCGTIRGCSDYLHEHGFTQTKICVADSPGSVIFGGIRGSRSIPGHGAGIRPTLYQDGTS